MQGLPAPIVTNLSRGLLPHVFILTTTCVMAVIFCGTCCQRFPDARLFTGALHYAVRTFLQ